MPLPTIEFLQNITGWPVWQVAPELLKENPQSSAVYRLRIALADEPDVSLILKHMPGDHFHPMPREVRFYREILPRLAIPHPQVYYSGQSTSGDWLILLEDLGATHNFPTPQHRWSVAEIRSLLAAYARLHQAGRDCLPPAEQRDWLFSYSLEERQLAELPGQADELVRRGAWPDSPPLRALSAELAGSPFPSSVPASILHNDLYPPNIALPRQAGDPAVVVDWDMAGWGPAELDLAYLLLQPFRSGSTLPQESILELYWQARRLLGDEIPSEAVRTARLRAARLLLGAWFVPRLVWALDHPSPPGTPVLAYWQGMTTVLYEQLSALCGGRARE